MTIAWAIIIVAVLFLLDKYGLLKKSLITAAILISVIAVGCVGFFGYQWKKGRWEYHQVAQKYECFDPSTREVHPVSDDNQRCSFYEQLHLKGTPLPFDAYKTPIPAESSPAPPKDDDDIFKWPSGGLPTYIADALSTPDLAPNAPGIRTEVMLSASGQKQFISTGPSWNYCGSGGCSWGLIDAATKRVLIKEGFGSLHKTTKSTDGYYELVLENKWQLSLLQDNGEEYQSTNCYTRIDGLGSSARPTSCTTSE